MGLQLPEELRYLLMILGYDYPAADESKLYELGQAWLDFAEELAETAEQLDTAAAQVWDGNTGDDIEAFKTWWSQEDSPAPVLGGSGTACTVGGVGIIVCAAIILALKIAVIIQLVVLAVQIAQAIATAAATFGGSLAEIPIFQQLARTVVGNLIEETIWALIDG